MNSLCFLSKSHAPLNSKPRSSSKCSNVTIKQFWVSKTHQQGNLDFETFSFTWSAHPWKHIDIYVQVKEKCLLSLSGEMGTNNPTHSAPFQCFICLRLVKSAMLINADSLFLQKQSPGSKWAAGTIFYLQTGGRRHHLECWSQWWCYQHLHQDVQNRAWSK